MQFGKKIKRIGYHVRMRKMASNINQRVEDVVGSGKNGKIKVICLIVAVLGGLFVVIAAPIARANREEVILDVRREGVSNASQTTIREAFTQDISLEQGQKYLIEFSTYYVNSTVNFVILGNGNYESRHAANQTSPGTGLTFLRVEPVVGNVPSVQTGMWINFVNDGYRKIEFLGDGQQQIPGDYVIVIDGENPGTGDDDDTAYFNLKVTLIQDTSAIKTTWSTLGWILFLVGVGLFIYFTLNPVKELTPEEKQAKAEAKHAKAEAKAKKKAEKEAADARDAELEEELEGGGFDL